MLSSRFFLSLLEPRVDAFEFPFFGLFPTEKLRFGIFKSWLTSECTIDEF